jgi:hypothetical protein
MIERTSLRKCRCATPRRALPWAATIAAWIGAAVVLSAALHAQIDVLTNRYDGARTGANLNETTLTVANVNVNQFGKLYSYPVDGSVYAQPLYVSGVSVAGTLRNVLYVATMNDRVYAFDADSASPTPLWSVNFTNSTSVTPVPVSDIVGLNQDIVGNVGIESTPVIDRAAGTIFLVARTKENGAYVQRLHALNIATGQQRPGSPVTITGSVLGSAMDATVEPQGSVVRFNPKMQQQRAALALSNGVVLISWAGHHDLNPYHGWVMGYDAVTLQQVGVFAVSPDVYAGGIWQGGRAPTIDAAGNAYFATGNGKWDGTRNFGDSLLKFSVSRTGIALVDFFTPANEAQLSIDDDDLSGSGFTLLPGTNLLVGGGKEGVLYVLDSTKLGKKVANDAQIVQKIAVNGGHVMGGIVYWNSPTQGPVVYNWSEDDVLTAFRFNGTRLEATPFAQGAVVSPGHPGGSLTISARGSTPNTGIVWASLPTFSDAISGLHAGIVRAFNADTLEQIWNSEQNPTRDRAGTLMKFVPPLVANGKVFMPNHKGAVGVYSLLPTGTNVAPTATITQPVAGTLYGGAQVITYAGTGSDQEDGTLTGSAFTWRVDFHHDTHTHAFIAPTSGATGGSFTIPTTGETSANVWYRIHLTVRDSAGLTHTTQRDVMPRKARLTLATSPAGLQLKLDGQPVATPFSFDSVVGIARTIEAPTPQTSGASTNTFASWSDGGAASHVVSTPAVNTTYTATYTTTAGGTVNGLSATYFDNSNLTGAAVTRVDPTVDFVWGSASPAAGIGAETFSARWTGQIEPQFSETYTFYTVSNDGVRLWINGVRVVSNWTNHGTTENRGQIALTGGQRYAITMEFYEDTGNATARLLWSSASTPKAVVPSARLYATAAPTGPTPIRVNFQTASAPVPPGYLKDGGLAFGDRGNGQSYGWNMDNTAQMRDRNSSASPDQRYDTLAYMQRPANPDAVWELAVPNGSYTVRVVAGDPSYWDTAYKLSVEGVLVVSGTSNSASRWVEGTSTVTVSDGRLTIRSAAGATANKICFVEITPQ